MLRYMVVLLFCLVRRTSSESKTWLPNQCEVCQLLVEEISQRLHETESSDTLKVSESNLAVKSIKYDTSYLLLCLYFALVKNRGVDVKLDVPFEMWDQPSVEITSLYKQVGCNIIPWRGQCVNMISNFEDELEDWFYHHQEDDLLRYFCRERVLKKSDQACLSEKVFRSSNAKTKSSTDAKRSDL
ncbi:hypothetical protein AHF37_01324 [Paragonimus kellicotti]|nr:hypothetical protein AHF37_01324 [Paragonimus kellicotti]